MGAREDLEAIGKEVPEGLPKVKKVAVAYSGGLDSALVIRLLQEFYGAEEVIPVTVNVGLDEEELENARKKAEIIGVADKWRLIDRVDEFVNEWVTKAIRANASYEGYPVSTSMTRQLIAREVAKVAVEEGCDALAEGSTGKGNDQFRMHHVFKTFAPDLTVVLPIRDFNFTRQEEMALCERWGIPYKRGIGDDRTLWCRSIGSGEVDNLKMQVPPEEYIWWVPPEKAPDEPVELEIEFDKGIPVRCAVDGQEWTDLKDIIENLNVIAGRHGIGKIDMFEDGIMGLKSREVYEAPAAKVILALHKDLEQLCLTKDEVLFKPIIDEKWAYMVYHGGWYHPLKRALDAFIEATQEFVRGRYRVRLYKGTMDILERESDVGLFAPEIRSLARKGFDQRDAGPMVKISALQYEILARRRGRPE